MHKDFTKLQRQNFRHARTVPLTHLILSIIRPHLRNDKDGRCYEREEQIFNQIRNELEQVGAEIITDQTREAAGLPPRGPDGWTLEEIAELERRRLELMARPLTAIMKELPK